MTRKSYTLTVQITVNPELWNETYGPDDLATDVRDYVHNAIAQSAAVSERAMVGVVTDLEADVRPSSRAHGRSGGAA